MANSKKKAVVNSVDSRVQAIVNAMIKRIADSSAVADSRTEVWYMPIDSTRELHVTLAMKPIGAGKFEIVRNKIAQVIDHEDIKPTDSIVMKATFEMFAWSQLTIHASKELVRVVANVEFALDLQTGDILAMARNKESKKIDLSPMHKFNGTQFASVTESELVGALESYTGKFMNKVANNTPAEPRKREYSTRDNTAESNRTLYGHHRAMQVAKREAKKAAESTAS